MKAGICLQCCLAHSPVRKHEGRELCLTILTRSPPPSRPRGCLPQCEENANLQDAARYLKLPFSKGLLLGNSSQATKATKESFWITSSLCSTKLTQNGTCDALPLGRPCENVLVGSGRRVQYAPVPAS